jgi:DNA-binding NtrC family response regulator
MSDDHPGERSCPPQTILFVEDEALVRIEMEEFLRECGYRVHGVANAAEAIEALEAKFAIDSCSLTSIWAQGRTALSSPTGF